MLIYFKLLSTFECPQYLLILVMYHCYSMLTTHIWCIKISNRQHFYVDKKVFDNIVMFKKTHKCLKSAIIVFKNLSRVHNWSKSKSTGLDNILWQMANKTMLIDLAIKWFRHVSKVYGLADSCDTGRQGESNRKLYVHCHCIRIP